MRSGLLFIFLSLLPLSAQNVPQGALVAGMQQDLAELRNEVEKLKLENADLRAALNQQRSAQSPAAAQSEALAKSRVETLAEVDRRLKQQTADVNAALAELTRQVNAALGKTGPAPSTKSGKAVAQSGKLVSQSGAQAESNAPSDDGLPADMPRTGIKYHVKSGDTVIKIALRNGSKPEWILKANNLASPAALKADVDIFVPQLETSGR